MIPTIEINDIEHYYKYILNDNNNINNNNNNNKNNNNDNFIKTNIIAPDGTHCSTISENNRIQLLKINDNLINDNKYYKKNVDDDTYNNMNIDNKIIINEINNINVGESVFDLNWFPYANIIDPLTYCYVTTSRDHPIHLWDALTGKIRCSYIGYNNVHEVDKVNCVSFNLTGDKLYSGSNRMIRCFDVANPGSNYIDIPTCRTKKDPMGQKGIISCIQFNPDNSGVFAAGSYSNSVGIYVENLEGCALELRNLDAGITCLRWSIDGNNLWIGGRNSSNISCWDIRKTRCEIGKINRDLTTNQKITFDLDPWGKYLATGTENGNILIYDTMTFDLIKSIKSSNECINSCCFHRFSSLLFSTSGQRHFNINDNDSDDEIYNETTNNNSSLDIFKIGCKSVCI